MMAYGDKRNYPKIHVYTRIAKTWHYAGTTTWAKTCKEAVAQFYVSHPEEQADVKANFAEPKGGRNYGRSY